MADNSELAAGKRMNVILRLIYRDDPFCTPGPPLTIRVAAAALMGRRPAHGGWLMDTLVILSDDFLPPWAVCHGGGANVTSGLV